MSHSSVILLSHDFQFVNMVPLRKAIKLIVKNRVEVVKADSIELREGFYVPKVVRLLKAITSTFNKKIPYSKLSIFIRDGYVCQYCGKQLNSKTCTIDHVVPVSKGGKNTFTNCATSCKVCNNWKGDKMLSETNMQLLKPLVHPSFMEFMYMKMKSLGIDLKDIWEN